MARVWFVRPGRQGRTPAPPTEIALSDIIEKLELKVTDFHSTMLPSFPSPNPALNSFREPEWLVVETDQPECNKHPGWKVGFYCPGISVAEARSKLGLSTPAKAQD